MKTPSHNFSQGFQKIAATELPQWLREANKRIEPLKQLPAHSKHSVSRMLKHRGVK